MLKSETTGQHFEKLPKKRKKQQRTEKQKNAEYRNTSEVGARFLNLACQGSSSQP